MSPTSVDWVEEARCRGADHLSEFVPDTGSIGNRRRRLASPPDRVVMLCAPCPVNIECLRYGFRHRTDGWWGGVLLHHGKLVQPDGHLTLKRQPHRAANGEGMEFFLAEFDRDTDECQDWPYGQNMGFGVIEWYGRSTGVHLIACTLAHGPRPHGLFARHTCDNRLCFNKRHLYWGQLPQLSSDRSNHATRPL